MSNRDAVVELDRVEALILSIRGRRVILDSDLARHHFPPDFMFPLSRQEFTALISQNATSKGRGGRRKLPNVFTEHGAIMAANVLNSGRAIEVSVYVVRAFVRLREMTAANKEVATKLGELERKVASHDEAIRSLVTAIRRLMESPSSAPGRRIGFRVEEGRPGYGGRRRRPRKQSIKA